MDKLIEYDEVFAKCGFCGACRYWSKKEVRPCECKDFLFFTYIWRARKYDQEVELKDGKYDAFAMQFATKIRQLRLFHLVLRWGYRKWKIVCGEIYLTLCSKKVIDYSYD